MTRERQYLTQVVERVRERGERGGTGRETKSEIFKNYLIQTCHSVLYIIIASFRVYFQVYLRIS